MLVDPATRRAVAAAARMEQERRAALAAMKDEAEDDLLVFVRMFWRVVEPVTPLVEGWVLSAMADMLMAVTDGHITRAIVNVPPGSMKSMLLNVFWPAWEWGPQNMPHLRYLSASYSSAIPERDNARLLRVISDPVYLRCWGDRFGIVRAGLTLLENDKTGWKRVISTSSGTTGHRADRILCDDLNDPNDVESESVRAGTIHWVREVMPDRLNNMQTSAIVNVQQRTHEQDATGVLAEHGDGYAWMSIPMEFDPLRLCRVVLRTDEDGSVLQEWVDPRGVDEQGQELAGLYEDERGNLKVRMGSPMAQAEGVLAWPERFPPETVASLKKIKGPYAWAGQYNQAPTVRGGAIIWRDWWQTWSARHFPSVGTVIVSLDTAIKESEGADYTALTVWGAWEGVDGAPQVMLLDAWRDRLSLAETVARTAETCFRWKADYLLIEDKARGHDASVEIQRQYADRTWETILIKVNSNSGDKEARLRAVSPLFSGDVRRDPVTGVDTWVGGMVWAPATEWAEEVINEVTAFPRGSHDDYVDTVSQAMAFMRRHGVVLRKAEHDAAELEAKRFRKAPGVPYAIGGGS
jgi:predicted phage terminase large subunit-like protein